MTGWRPYLRQPELAMHPSKASWQVPATYLSCSIDTFWSASAGEAVVEAAAQVIEREKNKIGSTLELDFLT